MMLSGDSYSARAWWMAQGARFRFVDAIDGFDGCTVTASLKIRRTGSEAFGHGRTTTEAVRDLARVLTELHLDKTNREESE